MAGRPVSSRGRGGGEEAAVAKQLVQSLRGDLNTLSNEAKKKYPAVKEAAERGGMYLKTRSEATGFSIQVLASSDDVVHPLLFACETKNPVIVKTALSAIQRLIQFKAIPQVSVESIVSSVSVLMESGVEELKVLQTILLLVTTTDVVQGRPLAKVLLLCFKMYGSRDLNIHNTAGVVIRQIVSSMFERLNSFISSTGSFDWGDGQDSAHGQLPVQASDAYLLFQDICFLTNGDPPAWLSPSLELELILGLELLESVLRTHPKVFTKEKLFSQLLTERVCPLVVKLFSPSSKYRHSSPTPTTHSPTTATLLSLDKPTFGLSVRLLRILNVLIREFYFSLVTQCEIFLSMLVKFLDPDKPMWQRTLAVEILHAFCNQPDLLKSFCESYDMQEHSSKIFGDIVDALGSFIQSYFTSHITHFPFTISALSSSSSAASTSSVGSGGVAGAANGGHVTGSGVGSGRLLHQFGMKGSVLMVEPLPSSAHTKPICLEMLDKSEVPPIPEGYPLVVAMTALLDAVRSVSVVINGKEPGSGKLKRARSATTPTLGGRAGDAGSGNSRETQSVAVATSREESSGDLRSLGGVAAPAELSSGVRQVERVMLQSSWSGVLAALALLLDACMDERTTGRLLKAHQTFILLCGQLQMMSPRDAFLTSLCKGTLPPRYTMSLIAQRKAVGGAAKTVATPTTEAVLPPHMMPSTAPASTPTSAPPLHTSRQAHRHSAMGASHDHHHHHHQQDGSESLTSSLEGGGGARRKLNVSVSGSLIGEGVAGGVTPTPMKEQPSGLVSVKNLQCIHTLLQIINHQGNLLDSAWFLVMKTLQLIVEVFGCVHMPGGGYKEIAVSENSSLALVSTSKKDDVTALPDKLIGVFRSSRQLRDDSVLKMVDALSQLMHTSMPGVGASKECSLFPIAALQEVGEANASRLDTVWQPVTSHLSETCCHGDTTMRCFAAEALMALIKEALEGEKNKNESDQLLILSPLKNLVLAQHVDVRLKQLECVSQVLHSSGQSLRSSWSVILDVIRSATQIQSESVVRSGFQSLQLVIADFLPAIPHSCLSVCVDMSGQYGLQTVDINISLTSIGLLWNLADYLFQNKTSLKTTLSHDAFDNVWMLLFKHLSDLCVDERAAVRKSACQTLFSTISAHGTLLRKATWKDVLWKILFPLLEGVSQATGSASTSSFQTSLLIHHSRNTEQKQWAETQVLTLTGSARLLQSRWSVLSDLDGFMEAWSTFLGIIKECAYSNTSEVSLAAMKCFRTIVDPQPAPTSSSSPRNSLSPGNGATPNTSPTKATTQEPRSTSIPSPTPVSKLSPSHGRHLVGGEESMLPAWIKAWEVWSAIGDRLVFRSMPNARQLRDMLGTGRAEEQVLQSALDSTPSQPLLVGLLEAILQIYPRIQRTFTDVQYRTLSGILRGCHLIPVPRDVSPFLVPSHSENALSSLQRLVLQCIGGVVTSDDIMRPKDDQSEDNMAEGKLVHTMFGRKRSDYVSSSHFLTLALPLGSPLVSLVLQDLLSNSSYAHTPPDLARSLKSFPSTKTHLMNMNFVPFSLSCQALAVQLYRACVREWSAEHIPASMHVDMLQALHPHLRCRYTGNGQQQQQRVQPHPPSPPAPPSSVWLHSVEALLLVLRDALPLNLGKGGDSVASFWDCLGAILEDFLFCEIPEGYTMSSERMRENEDWDIKVVEMIKKDILSATTPPPRTFLVRLASLLNKGSIHTNTDQFNGGASHVGPAVQLRENFARACFEALLQFSFMQNNDSTLAADPTGQMALNALLERCDEVLKRFVEDERLSGSCPLPRTRMNEVSLVLKSVTILISALKEAQQNPTAKVDAGMWAYVTRLYPALVQCVTCKSHDVRVALREALGQFSELLQPSLLQHSSANK